MTPVKDTQISGSQDIGGRIVGVIEIGTTSIRMMVAQVDDAGSIHVLESLQQSVAIGKDTFTKGSIDSSTTEECVVALKSYKGILSEYHVTDAKNLTAVATSAVREASNCEAFLDRVFIATGINVQAIDHTELSRFTYLAVAPMVLGNKVLAESDVLVSEVGGGSTEVLMLRKGKVESGHNFRLGSYRLRKMLDESRAPLAKQKEILTSHVKRVTEQIYSVISPGEDIKLLFLGSEARFAAACLSPSWDKKDLVKLEVSALSGLVDKLAKMPIEEIVNRHHISFAEAETMAPALLTCLHMAQQYKNKVVYVCTANVRTGILVEMTSKDSWGDIFKQQIVNSALEIGKKYSFDQNHAEHVAEICRKLFVVMKDEHKLDARYELILNIAALLHDIGAVVNNRSHHKHSMYLILNSDIFGLSSKDLLLTAMVARYHRRSPPKPAHLEFNDMDRDDKIIVLKLAALLRVADALDRGHVQTRQDIDFKMEKGRMVINAKGAGDLTLERYGIREKGNLFEQIYGMKIFLESLYEDNK